MATSTLTKSETSKPVMPKSEKIKSTTDHHWNTRAKTIENDIEVNIMDVFQREFEYDYVCKYLKPEMRILEVGCGNGFSTRKFRKLVAHVDAFDYSENMIERAKATVGEKNNRFFQDNLLAPEHVRDTYDAVVCIRVLINIERQKEALRNMIPWVKPGGLLILVEGYTEGFASLTQLRAKVGLPPVQPAKINYYCPIADFTSELEKDLVLEHKFHLGSYDYLTRVLYPLVVGHDQAKHNTNFSEKCVELARAFNADAFEEFSRIRGFVFRKNAA